MRDVADSATWDTGTGAFLVGCVRVSPHPEGLTGQEVQLRSAGCVKVFAEQVIGAQPGRSVRDLCGSAERIRQAGSSLRSFAEPCADTTAPAGGVVLTMFGDLAGLDRSLTVERTSIGRAAARARGTKSGRKPALSPAQIDRIHRLVDEGKTGMNEIASMSGIH
ncbi:recombinase family protein [Paraburkholderia sp. SIMBA_055]